MKWDGTKISRRNKMLLGDLIINHDNKRIPLSAKQRENIEKIIHIMVHRVLLIMSMTIFLKVNIC